MKYNSVLALLGVSLATDDPKTLFMEALGQDTWFVPGSWSYKYELVEDDPDLKTLFEGLKLDLQTRTNDTYSTFIPKYYKQQVVAGMKYEILYDIGEGNGFLQVLVWHKLDETNEVVGVSFIDSDADYSGNAGSQDVMIPDDADGEEYVEALSI